MPNKEKLHLYDKILSPLLTEKSTNLSGENKIVFKVRRKLTRNITLYNIWCHLCLTVTKHREGRCTVCKQKEEN